MLKIKKFLLLASLIIFITSCSFHPPIKLAKNVNINKFMGDWYVIAYTPVFIDKNAYNGIETYKLKEDSLANTIVNTTFTFNEGSFKGKKKEYNPTGFIVPNTENAVWKMQFLWPFKSDYRIMYVDENYQDTIIARKKRDLFWIMSRSKEISKVKLEEYLAMLKAEGYSIKDYRMMPQN